MYDIQRYFMVKYIQDTMDKVYIMNGSFTDFYVKILLSDNK